MPIHRKSDPDCPELIESWKQTQLTLRKKLIIAPLDHLPRFVAGANAASSEDKKKVLAAIYDREEKRIIEVACATRPIEAPYTPTFLVLACTTKYRIPEPPRQADIEVAKLKA